MSLGGLTTEIGQKLAPNIDILMQDGITVVATNYIYLNTDVATVTEANIVISTIDGSDLKPYSWTILSHTNVPITISNGYDSLSQDIIVVSYAPQKVQQLRCVIRFLFNIGINEFNFDVNVAINSNIALSNFSIDKTIVDFGELGDLLSLEKLVQINWGDAICTLGLLSFKFSSSNELAHHNFKIGKTSMLNGSTNIGVIPILFTPTYSRKSDVVLTILYNNRIVIPEIHLTGSKQSIFTYVNTPVVSDIDSNDTVFVPKLI